MSANTSRVRHISTTSQDMPFPVAASIRRQHKAYNASDTPNFAGVPLWSARYPDTNKRRVASTLAGAGAEAVLAASSADIRLKPAVRYTSPLLWPMPLSLACALRHPPIDLPPSEMGCDAVTVT